MQSGSESRWAYGGVVSGPVFKEVADKIYAEKIGSQPLNKLPDDVENSAYRFFGLKKDLNKILSTFNYPATDSALAGSWRSTVLNNGHAELNSMYEVSSVNKVPDVTGLGLKDAVYLLENMGLKVEAKGRGKVIYQSIAQNTDFHKGESINLQLN